MANNHQLPQHLFQSLHLTNPENYNIYLVGSRLWGTNTRNSDWDLLIVGDIPSKFSPNTHKSQYDVKLFDRETFRERINEGSLIEVICALLRKEDLLQHAFDIERISIKIDSIRNWINLREEKDFDKAEKFWHKGNRESAWKILRHILQARTIFNSLTTLLQQDQINLTIDDIQNIVRPVTFICDKTWIQLQWNDVHSAVIEALNTL